MLGVTIDASVIAVPPSACSADDAHKYVETLMDWRSLLDEPWVAIRMSGRAAEALAESGLYPLRPALSDLFRKFGIEEYSVNDVARLAENLLTITPHFEDYYSLHDVLAEPLETDPHIAVLSVHESLQTDLARCIVLMAILRAHCQQPPAGHSLILRSSPKPSIRVRAQIHALEHERNDIQALPKSPAYFEGEVLACDDFKGLVQILNESAILMAAVDNLGAELAIRIALFKDRLADGEEAEWANSESLSVGHCFLETCQQCCRDRGDLLPPKILRAIVETLRGKKLADVHPLRVGEGGNAPQRMRGKDRAQRRDIDYDFHLHYWECEDGSVELGSVVHHNDFSIPE